LRFDVLRQFWLTLRIWALNSIGAFFGIKRVSVAERQTLPPLCQVFCAFTAYTDRPASLVRSAPLASGAEAQSCLLFKSASCLRSPARRPPAYVRKRPLRHDARPSVGPLRFGRAFQSAKPSLTRFPLVAAPRRTRVGLDGCASRLPCRVRPIGSCDPVLSCGDIHVAACSVIIQSWRIVRDCDASCRRFGSPVHNRIRMSHPAEERERHPARQRKRPPRVASYSVASTPVQTMVPHQRCLTHLNFHPFEFPSILTRTLRKRLFTPVHSALVKPQEPNPFDRFSNGLIRQQACCALECKFDDSKGFNCDELVSNLPNTPTRSPRVPSIRTVRFAIEPPKLATFFIWRTNFASRFRKRPRPQVSASNLPFSPARV